MIEPFAALEQCLVNEIKFLKRAVARAAEEAVERGTSGGFRSVDLARPLAALDSARRAAEESAARAWLRGPSCSRERMRALHCKELRQRVASLSAQLAQLNEGHLTMLTGGHTPPVRRVSIIPAEEHAFALRGDLQVGAMRY
ncbi:MAG: hypothetical protein JNK54_01240 [Elusimicrobia bacterium]|jgi:hypothetical protein|nr:hypothetical protein [Elusimicrobiota bacterium]